MKINFIKSSTTTTNLSYKNMKLILTGMVLLASTLMLGGRTANTYQIDYSKYDLDGMVSDMMWCGASNEVILVLTEPGTVYRSRDRGSSWKKL